LSQSMGDGLLAYFGMPKSYGDDAERAVIAALEIVDAVARISARFAEERGIQLTVGVGIHTGIVVVGSGPSKSGVGSIAGQAPDQALQIEARAGVAGVVVSAATERLLRGAFECEPLGRHALRGAAEETLLFRVSSRLKAPIFTPTHARQAPDRSQLRARHFARSLGASLRRGRADRARVGRGGHR